MENEVRPFFLAFTQAYTYLEFFIRHRNEVGKQKKKGKSSKSSDANFKRED